MRQRICGMLTILLLLAIDYELQQLGKTLVSHEDNKIGTQGRCLPGGSEAVESMGDIVMK